MNICFAEMRRDVEIIREKELWEKYLIIPLMPEAMFYLDELGLKYLNIQDYIDVRRRDEENYLANGKAIDFVNELSILIKKSWKIIGGQTRYCEPWNWCYPDISNLFRVYITYVSIVKSIIMKEMANEIVIFSDKGADNNIFDICSPGGINQTAFFKRVIMSIVGENHNIRVIEIDVAKRESVIRKGVKKKRINKESLMPLFAPGKVAKRIEHFFEVQWGRILGSICSGRPKIVVFGRTKEINVIKKLKSKEGFQLVICDRFMRQFSGKRRYAIGMSYDEMRHLCERVFGTENMFIREIVPDLHDYVLNRLNNAYDIFYDAINVLVKQNVKAIIAVSGSKYKVNPLFAAARYYGIKSFIFQHGAGLGTSEKNLLLNMACYHQAEYFLGWGKKCLALVDSWEPKAKICFVGRLKCKYEYRPTDGKRKRVVFIPNSSSKGYALDSYWQTDLHNIRKKIIRIFAKNPEHLYILKPSPKERFREYYIDYWKKVLPNSRVSYDPDLSKVVSNASLVINDSLGTTMVDILSVGAPLIGYLRPSREKLYEEVERLARCACVFTTTEKEFLDKIEYYLANIDRYPLRPEKMREFIDNYATPSSDGDIYRKFEAALTE